MEDKHPPRLKVYDLMIRNLWIVSWKAMQKSEQVCFSCSDPDFSHQNLTGDADMSNRKAIGPNIKHTTEPIRFAIAGLLIAFGTLLASMSHTCTGLGRRWTNEKTLVALSRAIHSFHSNPHRTKPMREWERRLLGFAPSMIASIFGALAILWTLLLIGGVLSWLVMHGYGPFVLLGTVVLGATIGTKRASLKRQMPRNEQLN